MVSMAVLSTETSFWVGGDPSPDSEHFQECTFSDCDGLFHWRDGTPFQFKDWQVTSPTNTISSMNLVTGCHNARALE